MLGDNLASQRNRNAKSKCAHIARSFKRISTCTKKSRMLRKIHNSQSIYVRLDWVWRWLHHIAPCNAVRDDWWYSMRIWVTQPSGTADHFVNCPFFWIIFAVWGTCFVGCAALSVCLAICNILELEAAIPISLEFNALIFYTQYLQHSAQTFHVGWYSATTSTAI